MLLNILLIVLLIAINFYIANEFYKVAEMKGYSERKYFWIPFFFWFAGHLLIVALPDKNQQIQLNNISKQLNSTSNMHTDSLPKL